MVRLRVVIVIVSCAGLALAGSSSDAEKLFTDRCSSCHGPGGDGPSLKRSLKHGNTVDAVANVIKTGVPGTMMPPSGLADGQNRELARYVLSVQKKGTR